MILKRDVKDYFKINGKQRIKIPKKCAYVKFKNFKRKIKSSLIIYADFGSVPVPEDNGKQYAVETYTSKCHKHIACSCDYKLVCVDDKFSKLFKSYLGKGVSHNFINSMVQENKYCNDAMKKHFHKKLAMTKEDEEDFEKSA